MEVLTTRPALLKTHLGATILNIAGKSAWKVVEHLRRARRDDFPILTRKEATFVLRVDQLRVRATELNAPFILGPANDALEVEFRTTAKSRVERLDARPLDLKTNSRRARVDGKVGGGIDRRVLQKENVFARDGALRIA